MLLAQGLGLHSKVTQAAGEQRSVFSGKGGLSQGGLESMGDVHADRPGEADTLLCIVSITWAERQGPEVASVPCFGRCLKGATRTKHHRKGIMLVLEPQ